MWLWIVRANFDFDGFYFWAFEPFNFHVPANPAKICMAFADLK